MTRINQLIAVRQGVQGDAAKTVSELTVALSNTGLLTGLDRRYQPNDPEHGHTYAGEKTKVQITAEDALAQLQAALTRLFDITLTLDAANAIASADITVTNPATGEPLRLAQAVPVTTLMFLGKELARLRAFVQALPVQDPAEDWTTEGAPPGQWRSDPVVTDKTKQVPRNHVKWEPPNSSYSQPAQVDVYTEVVPEGRWTTVKFTGALPARQVREYLDRVSEVQRAVEYAREEANSGQVQDEHIGQSILGFVFS